MKQLLTVLIIFLSLICKGQNVIYTDGTQNYIKSPNKKAKVYPPKWQEVIINKDSTQTNFDTIPILLIACDTSAKPVYDTNSGSFLGGSFFDYRIFAIKGYEIITKSWECCDPRNQQVAAYYWSITHIKYLDADKKELPKSIVVWLSKPN